MATIINQQNETIQWELSNGQAGNNALNANNILIEEIGQPTLVGGRKLTLANGRKQTNLTLTLNANAIVDNLDLILTANRSSMVLATNAADVRVAQGDNRSIVVDFGLMLTINLVSVMRNFSIANIYPWLGTKFDRTSLIPSSLSNSANYAFFNDVKSERLLITLSEGQKAESVLDSLELSLPDLPSGLSVSINGDEPVWQHESMVQLGTGEGLSEDAWNSLGQRRISLANAVAPYVQDSSNPNDIELDVVLKSLVPGELRLELESAKMRHIHRLTFENEQDLSLSFDFEGEQQLIIAPPSSATERMTGLQFSISSELNPIRAIPAIAAPANNLTELVLGKGRSACVRLDGNFGLVELAGLRFPLISGASGAEVSVVLWQEKDGIPINSIENAVSEPVNWTGTIEQWIRFNFSKAVPIETNVSVWAAIHVNRGEVTWKMAAANQLNEYPIRIGSPEGPWRALPAIFGNSTSLGNVAGRVHLLGNADQTKPLPPLLISIDGGASQLELSPSSESSRISIELDASSASSEVENLVLSIISRSEGSVKISEVDVITGDKLS